MLYGREANSLAFWRQSLPDLESLATAARTRLFSPYAALEENASRQPDAPAIFLDARRLSFAECLDRVTGCASWLLHNGFVPHEASGLCLRDELIHIDVAMAALCLGSAQVSLGAHENAITKRALARKLGITQLVVERYEPWMEGFSVIIVPKSDEGFHASSFSASGFRAWPLDRVCVFQNTSGSTSIPKTFGLTYERLLTLTTRYASDANERRSLRTGSIEFDAHRLARLAAMLAGNCSVFLREITLTSLVTQCEQAEVTGVSMGVYRLGSLLQGERQNSRRLPPFTTVHSGGSRVPGRLRRELVERLTDNLYVLYATSEVGMISRATPDQHQSFPEGVGFPASGVLVQVVDSNGAEVTPGEIGQIRVQKEAVPNAYIGEPEHSSNFQGEWFYPRDLVSKRDDDPLIYHGRSDDVMILNTINIFPSAIEDTLESHPHVKEAVAYSVKSRIHGEIPAAAVVLTQDASTDCAALLVYCRQQLGIRAPRKIICVDQIPRNAVGKPLRRELSRSQ